jgi:hypothetical protein
MESELNRLAPEGISVHANRVYLKDVTRDSLLEMEPLTAASAAGLRTCEVGFLQDNQHVLAGQALVILDARDFEARLAGAMAHLAGVLPALEEAREELVRAEDLYDRTLLSEHDRKLSRVAVAKLKAERAHADVRVARAALRLERSTLAHPSPESSWHAVSKQGKPLSHVVKAAP